MKIHEQELTATLGPCGYRLEDESGDIVADEISDEAMPLFRAVPKMARALLAHGSFGGENDSVWHTHACWKSGRAMCLPDCVKTSDALRSAGVL